MLGKKIINTGGVACTTDTTQILDGGTTQSTALYRFEDNANDTASGTGKFNKGGVFNGSSSKIDLPDNILPDNSTGSSSASVWFKSSSGNSAGDSECILDAYAYDTNKPGWGLFMEPAYGGNPDGHLYLANYSLGGTSGGTSASYRDGNWHHAVVVLDNPNNTIKVYLDGNSTPILSQTASAANVWPFTEKAAIGYQNANASYPRYFNGNIDQVRVFNKALSTSEITTLYNETTTTANTLQVLGDTSCIAAYTFEGNANDLDTSTPKNGTASNVLYDYSGTASNITYATGKFDKAGVFNGTTSKVTITSPLGVSASDQNSNFSVSMWLMWDSVSSTSNTLHGTIVGDYAGSNYGSFHIYAYGLGTGNGLALSFERYFNSTGYYNSGYATVGTLSNIQADQWHHVTHTYVGSTKEVKLYLDGTLIVTYTLNLSAGGRTTNAFNVFGDYDNRGAHGHDGKMDQIRLFDKALSPGEINSLYNETATTAALGTITNPSTIAYYKMQDAADETGFYNGTATNMDFNSAGKYGFAGKFNGGTSWLSTGLLLPAPQLTWSAWIKTSNTKFTYVVGDFNAAGANATHRFSIRLDSSSLKASINDSAGGLGSVVTFGTYTQYGSWAHIVITVDGASVKGYVNGSQLGSTQTASLSITAGVQPLILGAYGPNTSTHSASFDGLMDQVRIFNKAISASEVTKLYNEVQCANAITTPESYFNTKLYAGNNSTNVQTGLAFRPDMIWFKARNGTNSHAIVDSVRGRGSYIFPDYTYDEATAGGASNDVVSFDDNGFTLGPVSQAGSTNTTANIVAWAWKAAAANTTNNDGSTASTVRASQESGFSIVKTPSTSGVITFGHGLGTKPEMIINKGLTTNGWAWLVYHKDIGTGKYIKLDDNGIVVNNAGSFSSVTSTTITNNSANSSQDYINYCFASVDGYQRIGSFIGNGSNNGPFIYTGFEPAWVIIKNTNTGYRWYMLDNKRDTTNPNSARLFADAYTAEATNSDILNFHTNGFELITSDAEINKSGDKIIFMAIAANPDTTAPTKANSFKTKIYTGNGGTQSITGVGFKPDLTWIKSRNSADNHNLGDSVRGVQKFIYSNLTSQQLTSANYLTSFDTDGFSIGSDNSINKSSDSIVSWNWKALDHDRNLAAINNDGSKPSIVSANPEAGFSIVQHTSAGVFEQFGVGHGLSSAPQAIIMKNITATSDWYLLTNVIDGSGDYLRLNANSAKVDITGSATSLFRFDPKTFTNWWSSANTIINYCFHSVAGYSKVAYYTGTGSAFNVTLGFTPGWVLIKRADGVGSWSIFDNQRSNGFALSPDDNYGSASGGYDYSSLIQLSGTGAAGKIEHLGASATLNTAGDKYIYLAFSA